MIGLLLRITYPRGRTDLWEANHQAVGSKRRRKALDRNLSVEKNNADQERLTNEATVSAPVGVKHG